MLETTTEDVDPYLYAILKYQTMFETLSFYYIIKKTAISDEHNSKIAFCFGYHPDSCYIREVTMIGLSGIEPDEVELYGDYYEAPNVSIVKNLCSSVSSEYPCSAWIVITHDPDSYPMPVETTGGEIIVVGLWTSVDTAILSVFFTEIDLYTGSFQPSAHTWDHPVIPCP